MGEEVEHLWDRVRYLASLWVSTVIILYLLYCWIGPLWCSVVLCPFFPVFALLLALLCCFIRFS